jgi:hypothetical protein
MGKASRSKKWRRERPEQIECANCGALAHVEYVPSQELGHGLDALGTSKCACGRTAIHAAGDPKIVASFYEYLASQDSSGDLSLTKRDGSAVRRHH